MLTKFEQDPLNIKDFMAQNGTFAHLKHTVAVISKIWI